MLVIFLLLQIGISIFLSGHFIVAVLSYSTICKWICKLVFWDLVSLVTVNIMIIIQIYIHAMLWNYRNVKLTYFVPLYTLSTLITGLGRPASYPSTSALRGVSPSSRSQEGHGASVPLGLTQTLSQVINPRSFLYCRYS